MRGKRKRLRAKSYARLHDFFIGGNFRHCGDIANRRNAYDDNFIELRRLRYVKKSNRLGSSSPLFELNPSFFIQFARPSLTPCFVELHKPAGKRPLTSTRIDAAPNEQHACAPPISNGNDDVYNGKGITVRNNSTSATTRPRRRNVVKFAPAKRAISLDKFCHDNSPQCHAKGEPTAFTFSNANRWTRHFHPPHNLTHTPDSSRRDERRNITPSPGGTQEIQRESPNHTPILFCKMSFHSPRGNVTAFDPPLFGVYDERADGNLRFGVASPPYKPIVSIEGLFVR